MASTAMLNVRIDRGLKNEGDSVLSHFGLTPTEAIRSLYKHLEKTQSVPEWCFDDEAVPTTEQRRKTMRSLIGVAPLKPGEDVDAIKAERLSRIDF